MKIETSVFQKHVELRIESLLPIPYFAILMVSTVREVSAYIRAHSSRNPPIGDDLARAHIVWPNSLREYFHPITSTDKLRQMRLKSPGTARVEVRDFVLAEVGRALEEIKEAGIGESEIENSPLKFFDAFLKKKLLDDPKPQRGLQAVPKVAEKGLDLFADDFAVTVSAPVKNSDMGRLAGAGFPAAKLVENTNWATIELRVAPAFDPNSHDRDAKRRLKELFEIVALLCENYLKFRFEERYGHSVFFPGIGLGKAHILASAHLSLAKVQEDNRKFVGLFSVIREARGTVTNVPAHRNTVVRDLLWLRPHYSEVGSAGIHDYSAEGHGHRLGFYFSAFDRMVYEIKRIIFRDGSLMIDAIAHLDSSGSKSMCLYFPLMKPSNLLCSFGGMLGHAHDAGRGDIHEADSLDPLSKRTQSTGGLDAAASVRHRRVGGWTAVFYRPELDDTTSAHLQNYLSMYSDSLRLDVREDYDRNIEFLFDFADKNKLIGFYFSDLMLKRSKGTERAQLIASSKYFRDFFTVDSDYTQSLRKFLNEKIDSIIGNREKVLEFIERLVIEQLMYCITPQYNGVLETARFATNLSHFSQPQNLMSARSYHETYMRPDAKNLDEGVKTQRIKSDE